MLAYYLSRRLTGYAIRNPRVKTAPGVWLISRVGDGPPPTAQAVAQFLGFSRGREQRRFRANATLLVTHDTPEARDMHLHSGMENGLRDALDPLEETAQSLG